jgi:hypothetical protein
MMLYINKITKEIKFNVEWLEIELIDVINNSNQISIYKR